jgi:hypothetical protein
MRELQYAFRRLWGSPGFSIAAMLTLAIAIGATASVFSLVDAVLLKPFPFREPSRVLLLEESNPGEHLPEFGVSAPNQYILRCRSNARRSRPLRAGDQTDDLRSRPGRAGV